MAIGMRLPGPQPRHLVVIRQLRQPRHRPGDRLLMQHSRCPPPRIAEDVAVRWVGRAVRDSCQLQRAAVQAGVVIRAVVDYRRTIRDHPVQKRGRQVVVAEDPRLPPGPQHDRHALHRPCMGRQPRQKPGLRLHVIKLRRRGQIGSARQQVHMRILQPRQYQPPARIDPPCGIGRRTRPQRPDTTRLHQKPFGERPCRVHRAYARIRDQQGVSQATSPQVRPSRRRAGPGPPPAHPASRQRMPGTAPARPSSHAAGRTGSRPADARASAPAARPG